MDPVHTLRAIHRTESPSSAFHAFREALAELPLRSATWVDAEGQVREAWPDPPGVTDELLALAMRTSEPAILPLSTSSPADAEHFPACDLLLVPVRLDERPFGACLLIAGEGSFPADIAFWQAIGEALAQSDRRHAGESDVGGQIRALQRRVEEAEALHTLGLAVNRTLEPGEVLDLVARFARSLLGADYVIVSTIENGMAVTAASTGLRDATGAAKDYWLARRTVEMEKPLIVGGSGGAVPVEEFPFHAAEGMSAGLGIPLSLFGETFGALTIGYRAEREVTPRDVRFALTLAGYAAVAISNARLHQSLGAHAEQVERMYAELQDASEAKERFFSLINHELRNPIGSVLGYLGLVLDGNSGGVAEPARTYLTNARRSGALLLELVNDLLDLSKIAAGKMELHFRPCSVAEIFDGTLTVIQPFAAQNQVDVRVEPAGSRTELQTDPHRVQQVLVNLLSNAVKFTAGGQVRLSAIAEAGWLDFRVADTGPGLSPADQKLVFEEFEQVKGTRGGTGLGLPISRRLARLLGGDLTVESELGVGSTFILRLPLAPADPGGATGLPS